MTIILWEQLTATNADGSAVVNNRPADLIVQVTGTFSAGTITMQGSLDGSTWFALKDPVDADVAFTAVGGAIIRGCPAYVRPLLTGADGSDDLDVYLQILRRD